ncbi:MULTISPECIES: glycosyltransferase [Bacillus cereus group]|uniref:glycosyltransferase n=1 Tax=Bacillus cereus group TaxID=86661 RepID=UPI001E337C35|nr:MULTISPECIES: glycosyltransferase [Bacillus cereus group]HDR7253091.1 glycosyltransferase [Bacillus pacificus]MCC2399296.1 glycosyltransferase [Bacillus paranthracis]MCU5122629.1 glycosyltransferase [Bacillus paranthracis]MCU5368353.1 glycosyltransferase [Bacillus paranthracis]MCU5606951.1 glycosyltransferase [Bacillus paranthracis]
MSVITVIVTYNRKELLCNCLEGLLKQSKKIEKIIIVDNASTDGTEKYLKEKGYIDNENIEYNRLEENTGGAGGFKAGVQLANNYEFEWCWLMDDDVYPQSDCLENLLKVYEESNGEYSILQTNRVDVASNESLPYTTKLNFRNPFQLESTDCIYPDKMNDLFKEIVSIPFEGPLIKREVLKTVGDIDDSYFIICDDADFSIRAQEKGFKLAVVKNAIMKRHSLHLQKKEVFNWKDYYMLRNRIELDYRYGNLYIVYTRALFQFVFYNLKCIKEIKKFRFKDYKLLMKALKDGLLRKRGKRVTP